MSKYATSFKQLVSPWVQPLDKQATLQRLEAFRDEIEAEARIKRDAARWQWLNRCASDTQWQTVRMFDDCSEADAYIDAQIAKEQ